MYLDTVNPPCDNINSNESPISTLMECKLAQNPVDLAGSKYAY